MSDIDVGYDKYGSAKTFTLVAAAIADGGTVNYDQIRLWYRTNNRIPLWYLEESPAKILGLEGMLDRQRVVVATYSNTLGVAAWDLSTATPYTSDIVIRNLSFTTIWTYHAGGVGASNSSSSNAGAVNMERCRGFGISTLYNNASSYGYGDVSYCYTYASSYCVLMGNFPADIAHKTRITNCACLNCFLGFRCNYAPSPYEPLLWNSFVFNNDATTNLGPFDAASDHNIINTTDPSYFHFSWEKKRESTDALAMDPRQSSESPLIGQGVEYSGLTQDYDIDGRYITQQPIGPSIGGVDFDGSGSPLDPALVGTMDTSIR